MIYCDYAATTPMSNTALDVYQEVAKDFFGNSSSLHDTGGKAADILEQSRTIMAKILKTNARDIIFTSGGTESNLLAIDTLVRATNIKGKKHIITTEAEHSSLYYYMNELNQRGDLDVTYLKMKKNGQVSISDLIEAIQPNTCIVSIQHVNGETGVIQPIKQIGTILKEKEIYFHSDAVQSFGKIELNNVIPYVDSLTFSSHKVFGPKGVGAMYLSSKLTLSPNPVFTNHEFGLRPGTVNVPGIAAFTAAALELNNNLDTHKQHLSYICKLFIDQLKENQLSLHPILVEAKSPTIVGCIADFVQGDYLMLEYNRHGIAVSTGSACGIGQTDSPRSIQPFITDEEEGKRFVRFSFSHLTTEQDIFNIMEATKQIFTRLKEERQIHEKEITR